MNESINRPRLDARSAPSATCARCPASTRSSLTARTGRCGTTGRPPSSRTHPRRPTCVPHLPRPVPAPGGELGAVPRADSLTYRMYVNAQAESESKVHGVLEEYALLGSDTTFAPGWLELLGTLYTPSRYAVHGSSRSRPTSLPGADVVHHQTRPGLSTLTSSAETPPSPTAPANCSWRTRKSGIGTEREREHWQEHPAWQGTRKAVEWALATYDWGEAFHRAQPWSSSPPSTTCSRASSARWPSPTGQPQLAAAELPRRRQPAPQPLEPGPGRIRHPTETEVRQGHREVGDQVVVAGRRRRGSLGSLLESLPEVRAPRTTWLPVHARRARRSRVRLSATRTGNRHDYGGSDHDVARDDAYRRPVGRRHGPG